MKLYSCSSCSFDLWNPIFENSLVSVGLYDDARFPGRLIVMLRPHYDHLDVVPPDLAAAFMGEVQRISRIVREELSVPRMNMAVLGNEVAHVHAHLIPRRPTDSHPHKAPWEDTRARAVLPEDERVSLTDRLRVALS